MQVCKHHTHTHTVRRNLSHLTLPSLSSSLLPTSKALNSQPVLHPVPFDTRSPSSASRMAAASSHEGCPPPPRPPPVDSALHVLENGVWILRVVRRRMGRHRRQPSLLLWVAPADGWIVGGLSSPPQDGCRRAEGRRGI